MDTSKLVPNDARVWRAEAVVRGKTYAYMLGEPHDRAPVDTVLLLHGFPDCSFGWRCQVPYLVSLGLRVVVPDMLGYGGTDGPDDLAQYSFKSVAADVRELARLFVGDGQIILGGHDWGGASVWRVAMWYPELLKSVFSVCTPFFPPMESWIPLEAIISAGKLRNFTYQLQFAGPDVEEAIQGEAKVRQFLNAMWGGRSPDGKHGMAPNEGIYLDRLSQLSQTRLLSKEELDHYTEQYMKQRAPQLHCPLNWYRTRKINWEEEQPLAAKRVSLEMPTLFISAVDDPALPPSMSAGMEKFLPNLTRAEVPGSHWALTAQSEAVNRHIGEWLKNNLLSKAGKPAL